MQVGSLRTETAKQRENNYEDDSIYRRCDCCNRDVGNGITGGCESSGFDIPQVSTGEGVL